MEYQWHATDPWPEYATYGGDVFTPPSALTAPQDDGFNWKELPALLRDLYTARTMAEYQEKLLEIQLERARRGLPPLDPVRYGPGITVRADPRQLSALGIGAGGLLLALLGIGAAIMLLGRR